MPRIGLLAAFALVVGCAVSELSDGRDDSFGGDGKSDSAVPEGSVEALGVLEMVNEASLEMLDDTCGLASRSARNIVAAQVGADAQLGTDDDHDIATLAELDAVPWVGPVSMSQLLECAHKMGYIELRPACQVLDEDFEICLGEHAEGCLDIYEDQIQTCCRDEANPSQLCKDILEHLGG
jgi:hypothetical protein